MEAEAVEKTPEQLAKETEMSLKRAMLDKKYEEVEKLLPQIADVNLGKG